MTAAGDRLIIVADGPSAAGFVPPAGVPVMAVKGAILWLARADYWFSLDPNARTFAMLTDRRPGVRYAAAVPPGVPLPEGVERLERVAADPERTAMPPRNRGPEWWAWRLGAVTPLSEEPGRIHTGNSAYGALGWAYLLGYRRVLLVGVDGTAQARVSDGARPRQLVHTPYLFEQAQRQVDLSSVSRLGRVPRVTLPEWLNHDRTRRSSAV